MNKSIHRAPIRRIPLFLFFGVLMGVYGCSNNPSEKKRSVQVAENNIAAETAPDAIDILLPIHTVRADHSDYDDKDKEKDILIFQKTKETEQEIFIEASSRYYDQYISGKRFYAPILQTFPFNLREYLNLEIAIVNNTPNRLDIEELDVNVEKSRIDSTPFLFIYTSFYEINTLILSNESDFNWGGATLHYSLLKKGESFNGRYKKRKHIKYFDKYYQLNLLDDLTEMGYDFEKVKKEPSISTETYDNKETGIQYTTVDLIAYSKEDSIKYSKLFYPFEFRRLEKTKINSHGDTIVWTPFIGCARLYGKITFDHSDKVINFYSDIVLCAFVGGADFEEEDHFDVKLKTDEDNYNLRYPYTTVIEPYGMEMITLTVKADKSSTHRFYLSLKNNNNLNIRSKDINLHFMAPKNYRKYNKR